MTKFKVGDAVRKMPNDYDHSIYKIVKADNSGGIDTYTLGGTKSKMTSFHWWHNNELELVENKPEKSTGSVFETTHNHGQAMYCIGLEYAIEMIKIAGDDALALIQKRLEEEKAITEN